MTVITTSGPKREIDRRHRGCALERRQVLEPLGKAEQVAEEADDEAHAERRPRQHRPPWSETEERDSDRDHHPGGRRVRERGGEKASNLTEVADDEPVDQPRAKTTGGEHERGAAVRDREVAPRPTPPRGTGREHRFRAPLALLGPQPLHGLQPAPGADQSEDQERRREVGVDHRGRTYSSNDVLERLAISNEVLDAVGDRSVRDARQKDADRPPPHDATLQPHREPERASQGRGPGCGPGPGRDQPGAEVAPRRERRSDRGKARGECHAQEQGPPHVPAVRTRTSARGRSERTTTASRRPRLRSPARGTTGRAPRR